MGADSALRIHPSRPNRQQHGEYLVSLPQLFLLHFLSVPQVPWDERDQSAGPEGWMKTASEWLPADMLPCRYFVHT